MNNRALLLATLASLCCAAGIVVACGDFGSSSGDVPPVADAATPDALVAPDAAPGPDAALQPDATTVLDAGPSICGDSPVFVSNFEGNSLEEGWSKVLDGQIPVEGGKPDGSASLRALTTQSSTTPPNALALGLTTIAEVSGAGSGLMRELGWSGKCLGVRFDFNVPADARGYAIAFSVSPWKEKRYLSFTIDSGNDAGTAPNFTAWQDGPLDPTAASIGTLSLARGAWYRAEVRVTAATKDLGRYDVIITALPSSTQSASRLASWEVQTQAKVTVEEAKAQVKLELFGIVAEQRIWFDTVSMFAN